MKKKRVKIVLASLHRLGALCPGVRVIKSNCCPSVKDVNTSKVFMLDQTATKELKTLTSTRVTRSVIGQGLGKEGLF